MSKFEGETEEDRRLWNTYLHWARQNVVCSLPEGSTPALVDDPQNRISDEKSRALQAIIFAAFAVEYRLKRVLESMQTPPKRVSLQDLVGTFWKRLSNIERLDSRGNCIPPDKLVWEPVKRKLLELAELRDFIAHAPYQDIVRYCANEPVEQRAKEFYLNIIEAIKLINIYTGDEQRSKDELERHFDPMKTFYPSNK